MSRSTRLSLHRAPEHVRVPLEFFPARAVRADTAAGTVFLWAAVFKERGGGLHGYDYGSMIYYYLLTILVSNLVSRQKTNFKSQPTFGKARSIRCSRSR